MNRRLERRFRRLKVLQRNVAALMSKLEGHRRDVKTRLLRGAVVEVGPLTASLELLPGRNPKSKDPNDYELHVGERKQ